METDRSANMLATSTQEPEYGWLYWAGDLIWGIENNRTKTTSSCRKGPFNSKLVCFPIILVFIEQLEYSSIQHLGHSGVVDAETGSFRICWTKHRSRTQRVKIAREATLAYTSGENTKTIRGPFQTEAASPGHGIEWRSQPFQEHQLLNGTKDKLGTCLKLLQDWRLFGTPQVWVIWAKQVLALGVATFCPLHRYISIYCCCLLYCTSIGSKIWGPRFGIKNHRERDLTPNQCQVCQALFGLGWLRFGLSWSWVFV